ncbi:MAG: DUF5777 family beta-barrel protein [Ferruginibacter sp.]
MKCIKIISLFLMALVSARTFAQDSTVSLLSILEKELDKSKDMTIYTTATFKTTRLINGHSVENVGKGVLDVKISHRFGHINDGGYELFGLDKATMRMGFDYGITKNLMIGFGRSTFQKTYDGFIKVKILRQSRGKKNMPVTLSYVPTIALKTIHYEDPVLNNHYSSRLSYTHQLIIGRKFSDRTSLQLMPTFVHQNLVSLAAESNDIFAIGIGGRQKLTKRISINAEYYYLLPGTKLNGTTNALSVGFDIETGGHVFQLHFTNSQGMSERTFVADTKGRWDKGDILFGFNISRVFTIGKKH